MKMRIGGAPASWGIFWAHNRDRFAPETYARELREAGYRYTELGPLGYFPTDPVELQEFLRKYDLEVCGAAHVHTLVKPDSFAELERETRIICQNLQNAGARYFVLMDESEYYATPQEQVWTEAQWQQVASDMREITGLVQQEYGLDCLFHPHIGTGVQTRAETQRLLDEVPPMGLCFDTAHYAFWEDDTLQALQDWRSRIPYIHLKNLDLGMAHRVRRGELTTQQAFELGVMQGLGEGDLEMAPLVQYLARTDYQGYLVIEEDYVPAKPETPSELARRNFVYLQGLLQGLE